MTEKTQAPGVSANYTAEQVERLQSFDVVTYADAQALAKELGKSARSIVAKVLSLEIPYEGKPKAPKREKGRTKADTAAAIRAIIDRKALGLEKAPATALNDLLNGLQHLTMGENADS